MADLLNIQNLQAQVEGKDILKGISLSMAAGEVHALMGPNGSGKSTLASVLMGHPGYEVTGGRVQFEGNDLLVMKPEARALAGMFLAFQYPIAVPGLTVDHFLRTALNTQRQARGEKQLSTKEFRGFIEAALMLLKFKPELLERSLNDGFSGGEKKRLEILQLAVLKPKLAILDETDSGLDVDALKIVAEGVDSLLGSGMSVLVITHYQRLLHYLKPTHVHIMQDGKLRESGGPELVDKIELHGYANE